MTGDRDGSARDRPVHDRRLARAAGPRGRFPPGTDRRVLAVDLTPTGQHQWAEKKLIKLLDAAIESTSSDLYTVSGVGVEIGTADRTALVPDIAVLDIRPVGTSFAAENVLLAGEIWSPANTSNEQLAKFHACENAGVPFFWSVAQDRGGPVELAAYRLDRGRYVRETTAKADGGAARISASPVPVELDVTALRA